MNTKSDVFFLHYHTGYLETTNATENNNCNLNQSISSHRELIPVCQFDPWQVVPRQVFTPYSHLLISTVIVVVSHIGCLEVTGVII